MTPQNPADQRPAPGAGPTTAPAAPRGGSGIPGFLKTAVPLTVLGAAVFGIAYMVQDAPQEAPKGKSRDTTLVFFADERRLGPSPRDPGGVVPAPNLAFRGFFESDEQAEATFWFENTGPGPAVLQPLKVSCSACSAATIAILPPDAARDVQQALAAASLPSGPATGLDLAALVEPAARLFHRARETQQYNKFEKLDWTATVPGAPAGGDGWSPQWGIVTLHFTPGAKTDLSATFLLRAPDAQQGVEQTLRVYFNPVRPFEVDPAAVTVPQLTAAAEPYTTNFYVASVTRSLPGPGAGPLTLPTPTCAVYLTGGQRDEDRFVEVGEPVPLTPADLDRVAGPGPVKSGYRVPVTVRPLVGGRALDIGPFERTIHVTSAGSQREVRLAGEVKGDAWLYPAGGAFDLGAYERAAGVTRGDLQVGASGPGVTVEPVEKECFIKKNGVEIRVTVGPLPSPPGGPYKFSVRVPPDGVGGEFSTGQVLFRVKGGRAEQNLRVPLRGNARN